MPIVGRTIAALIECNKSEFGETSLAIEFAAQRRCAIPRVTLLSWVVMVLRARHAAQRRDDVTFEADIERILFSESEIRARIDQLAAELTRAYADRDFTVVSVLKGSCVFVSDLIRRIPIPLELAFVAASSYRGGTESGALDVIFPAGNEIQGRDVLLVDDILDTGRTLKHLRGETLQRGAREVKTCVFLDKPARRAVPLQPDFRGFEVDDLFVVGYGLDFAGRYRNLPYVGALRESVFQSAAGRQGAAHRA